MNKQKTLERIKELGLIAVIRGPSPELTVQMVTALVEGGVLGIEITYTTPNAIEVVRSLDKQFGDQIVLGMGTLTESTQVAEARAAGARFLVSPVCEPTLIQTMVSSGLPVMIGALTPTEVLQAYKMGADVVKIFPGSLGGPAYIKALKGPFPYIPMIPTGGVSIANVEGWFAAGVFSVGAGSELCPPNLAKEGRFEEITLKATEFVQAVMAARSKIKS
ncbi:MAG: 2-dehydro-3-deoxyphosphogluconate aldolase [Chloroflexi bacterium GWB2_49_20]|nr:MAG: 2-dehydro-3-deoxyphosphogluconate aldolase [Chloroflexi bacterium GWB2_49_20]OGN78030.1 MAG: 2-dehydro-3-deoxyphosphogluconate aldolase [Chloroflexi bacterium GWC2_49_37]OGN85068.1 MAG: 2-dehydro-3-deoxyphosphogluconate aldolase [Chloroflexi bacterium GWD2_49_16]HBG74895.1 2-dehydro-3-deoxyphosphogluconate aldolase [Anaerolineae bacterium]HCC78381.1 2-dehydro-3-deoxyphosphogluconate aldolase [Anaerolineae bacterium]